MEHPPTPTSPLEVRRGDLAVIEAEHVTRIICVTDVTDTHLVAVLTCPATEMATDHDIIVHRAGTYDLVLEAECYLVVLATQVRNIVGHVNLDTVNAVRTSLRSDGASVAHHTQHPDYSTGLPLGGVSDPRRAHKERELDDIVVLRNPAHRVLFDDHWNPGYQAT